MSPAHSVDKLEQMLAADPASKVFLPLGEQYRKAGQLERAAEVLRAGLIHNPGYAAAEVALARVLLEQGDLFAGRVLLSRVVRAVPDNLLAQRLLEAAGGPPAEPDPGAGADSDRAASPEKGVHEAAEGGRPEGFEEETRDQGGSAAQEDQPQDEPMWASPESLAEEVEPPVPEPGLWKTDEPEMEPPPQEHEPAAGLASQAEADDGPPPGFSPFETVRLSRDELAGRLAGQDTGDEAPLDDAPPCHDGPPAGEDPEGAGPTEAAAEQGVATGDPGEETMRSVIQEEDEPLESSLRTDHGDEGDQEDQEEDQEKTLAPVVEVVDAGAMGDFISPAAEEAGGPSLAEVISQAADAPAGSPLDSAESARLLSLARLYRRQGDLDRAAGVYRDLLDGDREHVEARRELAELCGEGLAEISDEDLIPPTTRLTEEVQPATMESVEDARRRKVAFLRSWLEHIRSQP